MKKKYWGVKFMLDNLYENIGGKIKNWAKWIFIIEAIGAIITGLVLLFTDEDLILYGLLTLVCGPIVAWVGSWLLYAFGELVEDIHLIKIKTVGEIIKPVCTNKSGTTEEPNVNIGEEEKLKIYIEKVLEEKQKPKELLDTYWQYKKYVYGYYSSTEVKSELEKVIKKCEENDFEGNSQLMITVSKRKLSKL